MAICHLQNTCREAVGKGEQESHHSPTAFTGSEEALEHFAPWPATLPQLLPPGPTGQTGVIQSQPQCFPTHPFSQFRRWLETCPEWLNLRRQSQALV